MTGDPDDTMAAAFQRLSSAINDFAAEVVAAFRPALEAVARSLEALLAAHPWIRDLDAAAQAEAERAERRAAARRAREIARNRWALLFIFCLLATLIGSAT